MHVYPFLKSNIADLEWEQVALRRGMQAFSPGDVSAEFLFCTKHDTNPVYQMHCSPGYIAIYCY